MSLPHVQGGLRTAAVFSLCGLFALLAMGLTLLSSGVYRSTATDADSNDIHRTALSYLINQVRRSDGAGLVSVGSFGGSDALILFEEQDGYCYVTLLYCYEGQLRELYMEEDAGLAPSDGVAILPMLALSVALDEELITVTVLDEQDHQMTGTVALRSTGGGEQ